MDKPIYRRYCACCSFNTHSPATRAFARDPIAENGPKGACARPVAPWLGRPGRFAAQQPSSPALGPLRVAHAWALALGGPLAGLLCAALSPARLAAQILAVQRDGRSSARIGETKPVTGASSLEP